jgi:hypothetical protein
MLAATLSFAGGGRGDWSTEPEQNAYRVIDIRRSGIGIAGTLAPAGTPFL